MNMNRLDSEYPAFEAHEREKEFLRDQVQEERHKTTEAEARGNKMFAELTHARLLHEQDCADIASKHFENKRLGNRCTILEAKNAELDARNKLQSGRIEELESLLSLAGAERR